MHFKPTLVRLVAFAISIALAVLATIASVTGQNLPPPGAYQPIPNFTGVGAGLQFRKEINDRFSGAQQIAPAIATVTFANLPLEQDGALLYCQNCKLASPCVGTGTGAWALGMRGQWSCSSSAVLEENLNANGNQLTNLANGSVGGEALVFGQAAGSDLSGTLPNPIVQTVLGGKTPIYSNQENAALTDSALSIFGAATSVQRASTANITLNRPSTVVSGHTMIMGYFSQTSTAPAPPAGWTLIRTDLCSGNVMGSYYKIAGGSEPSSYTWTLASSYYAAALIDVGATASNPVDAISPATCANTPTLAGLNTSAQPENVVIFGAGVNGGVNQVGFSQGALATTVNANGILPFATGYLTANYSTTPSITLTGSGATEAAQMIAIAPSAAYSSHPVLQGDSYAELADLTATAGSNAAINGFNLDGRFNVKNPVYGAKGDGLSDDTTAIQAAYNAACSKAIATALPQTLWFPSGTYLTSFSIIDNCNSQSAPVVWKCESEGSCNLQAVSGGLFPLILHEGNYLSQITANGVLTSSALATGSGSSLNWGTNSAQFYDLKDAQAGNNPTGWSNAQPLNGASALSFEGFFNYAGGASGNIFIAESAGDDLNLGVGNALQIYLHPGSPNQIAACLTTTGSAGALVCTTPGGSISIGTTYEFELSYDGSTLRLFEGLPGATTTLAGSASLTGTIVQGPSEVFALGDGGTGLTMTDWNFQSGNHWLGQLDSIRISNVARHTSPYTAPTAKFANDGSTLLLMNNTAQHDVLLQVTNVFGLSSLAPVWIPLRAYGALPSGNTHGGFYNMTLTGGNYGLLNIGALYTTIDHVNANGSSRDGIDIWNNSYGAVINHLTADPSSYSEAGLVLGGNSGNGSARWIAEFGGYYGIELQDSGSQEYSDLFINPGSNQVAGLDMSGSSIFPSYSIHEMAIDFENGGSQVPVKIWGNGSYQFLGGDFQCGNNNAIQAAPTSARFSLSLFGGNVVGTPPALIGWKGSGAPSSPATWINPQINGKSLSASGVPLSSNPAYAEALSDVWVPPTYTVATLPGCTAAKVGWMAQVSDCNASCTTYLGTTFTGGGSTRSTVQCNGSHWELH